MSVVLDPRRVKQTCEPAPVCPACGGLECLCRPRFFAGQLLTDEDLNRLDTYIRGKNRLHNRMLHGWGVVNGLEVTCTPCHNTVSVGTGYAMSPCGEDIILCNDEVVDVCKLINACKKPTDDDCRPYAKRGDDACRETEQEWVLAICYDETPTRGIASLRGASASPTCSSCGCNGTTASSCGCSCHVKTGRRSQTGGSKPRTQLAQCEPTAVCEGHKWRVYRFPTSQFTPSEGYESGWRPGLSHLGLHAQHGLQSKYGLESKYGQLPTRYRACVTAIPEVTLDPLPQDANAAERNAAYQRICAVQAGLKDFLKTQGGYSCELAHGLATVPIPRPDNNAFHALYESARGQLDDIRSELRRYCRCSLMLPPAPGPEEDDCVPLATITVRGDDCTIIDICNFGVRQIALSVPALQYWLSLTPIGRCLNAYLAARCCGDRLDVRECYRWLAAGLTGIGGRLSGVEPSKVVPSEYFKSAFVGEPEPTLDVKRMAYAEVERSQLWRESAFDDLIGTFIEAVAKAPMEMMAAAEAEEVEKAEPGEVRDELVELRRTVRRQQERINDLIERMDKK